MKVVPEDVLTTPLVILFRGLQSTANVNISQVQFRMTFSKLLTNTQRLSMAPHGIRLTGPDRWSIENITSITGVSGCVIEGGSRECVHHSIHWVSEGSTVNSCDQSTHEL